MICRVCLLEADCPLNIFDSQEHNNNNIVNILQKHFWFKIDCNDAISTVICRICWQVISDFHQFYKRVEQAHLTLSEINSTKNTANKDFEVHNPTQQDLIDFIKEEINPLQEDIKQEEIMTQETTPIAEENPLYEPEVPECMVVLENEKKVNNDKNDLDIGDSDEVDDNLNFSDDEFIVTKKSRRTRKATKKTPLKPKTDGNELRKRIQRHVPSPRDDEVLKKHIPMGCDLCTFVGDDFPAMRQHFKEKHPDLKPYVMCCGRKLSKRFAMVQHAYKHEDPEHFKCKDCQKVFSNNDILRTHIMAYHVPQEELTYQCDQCPKRFSRRYFLMLHKPSHIPIEERSFCCPICPAPKAFASDHLLQIHMNMRHTKATNVCHVCAKEIRDKKAYEKHVRLHFEDSGPRIKCPRPDCDRWLKDEDNLKQHLRRHNDEGKIFTCSDCDRTFKNRRTLMNHISYTHKSQTFSCDECHKTFKRAITLREHMAQHTGEALYKCPFCPRTFNSNANMHSHKKKMHPVEWDIWRKTKRGSSQTLISNKVLLKMDGIEDINE